MKQTLPSSAIDKLLSKYPTLPRDYTAYLEAVGWGETDGGYMLYSGPVSPSDIYPQLTHIKDIVLMGDDTMGYCLGYDLTSKCYGEMSDSGTWSPLAPEMSLLQFLSRLESA